LNNFFPTAFLVQGKTEGGRHKEYRRREGKKYEVDVKRR